VKKIQQGIAALHEDLQYDYQYRLDDILDERS
jgi:hypothetical protein